MLIKKMLINQWLEGIRSFGQESQQKMHICTGFIFDTLHLLRDSKKTNERTKQNKTKHFRGVLTEIRGLTLAQDDGFKDSQGPRDPVDLYCA